MKNPDSRGFALKIIASVLQQQQSLTTALDHCLPQVNARDRALVQAISYGVVRWQIVLDFLLGLLLDKPLKNKDFDLKIAAYIGLYQLLHLRIPKHAATDSAVALAKTLGKPWATGLLNALLRNFSRQQADLLAQLAENEARWAHPDWLLNRYRHDWPNDWPTLVEANNNNAPLTLRINPQKTSRLAYLAQLAAKGIEAQACAFSPVGIRLSQAVAIEQLPDFAAGHVSVQDEAAQLAAPLLAVRTGMRVLDACCAPAGKTAHLLEQHPDGPLWALDSEARRMPRVIENLSRLQLKPEKLLCADASDLASWWDGLPFERILLDAPCSATGVIRRHPDIKLLRRANDITALHQTQLRLLQQLWQVLAPEGLLLYATCSVMPAENEAVVSQFLAQQPDAQEKIITATWGRQRTVGRQILPNEQQMDGFYYACLQKRISH